MSSNQTCLSKHYLKAELVTDRRSDHQGDRHADRNNKEIDHVNCQPFRIWLKTIIEKYIKQYFSHKFVTNEIPKSKLLQPSKKSKYKLRNQRRCNHPNMFPSRSIF